MGFSTCHCGRKGSSRSQDQCRDRRRSNGGRSQLNARTAGTGAAARSAVGPAVRHVRLQVNVPARSDAAAEECPPLTPSPQRANSVLEDGLEYYMVSPARSQPDGRIPVDAEYAMVSPGRVCQEYAMVSPSNVNSDGLDAEFSIVSPLTSPSCPRGDRLVQCPPYFT